MRHLTTLLAAAVVALTALTGCGSSSGGVAADCKPEHKFSTVKSGTLTVATFDLPPFTKIEGSKITGVEGQILDEVAQRECLTITPMPLDAPAVVPAAQQGRADLAAGDWWRTATRAEVVDLSDPIFTDQMGIISPDGVDAVPDLKGQKVGTVDGYLWVEDLRAIFGKSLATYPSSTAMWQDLKAGRIDAGIDAYGSAVYTNKNIGGDKYKVEVSQPDQTVAATLEPAQAAWPMPKGKQQALLDAINADIEALKKNGTIADILKQNGLDPSAADTGEPRLIK
jgi:polar amino acid transport system substrate-binding protein